MVHSKIAVSILTGGQSSGVSVNNVIVISLIVILLLEADLNGIDAKDFGF